MKIHFALPNIIIFLVLIFYFKSLGQTNSFIEGLSEEKIKIFDVYFYASEITGQKKFSKEFNFHSTEIPNELPVRKLPDFLNEVGTFRKDDINFDYINSLFNLSSQRLSLPYLDSINFDYYENVGIPKLKNSKSYAPLIMDEVANKLSMLKDNIHKKKYLFEELDNQLRESIIATRFDTIVTTFKISQEKVTQLTAELKNQLDTIKLGDIKAKAEIRNYLQKLADEQVKISGEYYIARLTPEYEDKISFYLKSYCDKKLTKDQFNVQLKEYMDNRFKLNSGLIGIRLNGSVDLNKNSISDITATLEADYSLTKDQANRITSSVQLIFKKETTNRFWSKFNQLHILRYYTTTKMVKVKKAIKKCRKEFLNN